MKRALVLALLAVAARPGLASQIGTEKRQTPKAVLEGKAKLVEHYNPNQTLRLIFGLKPPHIEEEERFLEELHTKGSPVFHHYLTDKEWNSRFAPSVRDEQAVVDWAQAHGLTVTHRYPNRLLVDVEAPVAAIEEAFDVRINRYQLGTATFFSNDREPLVPASLADILGSVQGLNSLERMHAGSAKLKWSPAPDYVPGPVVALGTSHHGDAQGKKPTSALKRSPETANAVNITGGAFDPTDIYSSEAYDYNALYNQGHCCNPFHDPNGSPPETSIAIAAFGDLDYNDVVGFHNQYPYLAWNVQKIYVDGQPSCSGSSQPNCIEVTMDTEYSLAMSNSFGSYLDTAKVWVYEGGNELNTTFTDMYNQMLNDGHARVFSTSWSCTEFATYSSDPAVDCLSGTMDSRHNIFNQMVGEGWTLVAASGDRGSTDDCANVSVSYPGSDPDVVSAGGTTLQWFYDGTFNSETGWQGGTGAGSCSFNNGGSGGGVSSYWSAPSYQTALGFTNREVPDISLNATSGENIYFAGALSGNGSGTSIVAPELAGFFAQENAYLLSLGSICGSGSSPCAPMGNVNYYLYYEGEHAPYAAHYPFYDITSGCNSNDITAASNLTYYCSGNGYDLVTGWGSGNMLQLSWAINQYLAGDAGAPNVTFSGPATNKWYNADQTVNWTVADTTGSPYPANGVAGFSQAWDSDPGDDYTEGTPGQGSSFYSGPQFPNATSGWLNLAGAGGQGCHTINVRAWDNAGTGSGDQTYGPLCYDTIAPSTVASLSPSVNGFNWEKTSALVALSASDPGAGSGTGSGVTSTYYTVDTLFCFWVCPVYAGPISVTTEGKHTVRFWSRDLAGNFEGTNTVAVNIDKTRPHTTAAVAGTLSGGVYLNQAKVTLSATDNLSGVLATDYRVDGGTLLNYVFPFIVSTNGTHKVTFYSMDYAGNVETTELVTFSIKGTTTTAVASNHNPSIWGTAVTLTATVLPGNSGTPTGLVTFKDGATTLGTATLSGGKAVFTTSSLALGSHSITASYAGDTNFFSSSSAVLKQVVQGPTTTSVSSSLNPSKFGQAVVFTAKVVSSAPGTISGTITFKNGASVLGSATISSGKAIFTTSALAVGTHSITAVYSGSTLFKGSASAALTQTVNKAATSTSMVSSLNPSNFGSPVTFTATVKSSTTGIPTGAVTFRNGATSLGTATLVGGKATFTTSSLAKGAHIITAVYGGSSSYVQSTSPALTQIVR